MQDFRNFELSPINVEIIRLTVIIFDMCLTLVVWTYLSDLELIVSFSMVGAVALHSTVAVCSISG